MPHPALASRAGHAGTAPGASAWRLVAVATLTAAAPVAAHAAELTLEPAADASIHASAGTAAPLADGSGGYLWLSTTAEGLVRRALLRFDLSPVPAGAVVRQAQLVLYESRSRTNHAVTLHRVLQAWSEGPSDSGASGAGVPPVAGDVTWANAVHPAQAWAQPGGAFDAVASASLVVGLPNQTYTWGSTAAMVADVQRWVDQPAANHGWILIGDETTQQSAKRFESRQNTVGVNRPRLRVVYDLPSDLSSDVPLPPWAALVAAALLAARLRQRRT